jgi:hypothetical protein
MTGVGVNDDEASVMMVAQEEDVSNRSYRMVKLESLSKHDFL